MPWKSKKQMAWGNSPAGVKALGTAGVKEWNAATKGKKLRITPGKKRAARPLRGVTDLL